MKTLLLLTLIIFLSCSNPVKNTIDKSYDNIFGTYQLKDGTSMTVSNHFMPDSCTKLSNLHGSWEGGIYINTSWWEKYDTINITIPIYEDDVKYFYTDDAIRDTNVNKTGNIIITSEYMGQGDHGVFLFKRTCEKLKDFKPFFIFINCNGIHIQIGEKTFLGKRIND